MEYILLVLVIGVYGLLNYYIGLRGFQSINAQIPINKAVYWAIIIFFATAYIVAMIGRNYLPRMLENLIYTLGGYWLAAFVYLLIIVVIIDILRNLTKRLNFIPGFIKNNTWFVAFSVIAAVAVILAIGMYNSIVPKVVTYSVNIDKKASSMKQLKVAMISDIHLSETIGKSRLEKAVEIINAMGPDIVVIAGDLIDNDIAPVKRDNMLSPLKNLKSSLGTYAILGNHEYYGRNTDEIVRMIEDTGVNVLKDKYIKIQDSFYLVGREDKSSIINGHNRLELDTLLKDIDETLPVIVLDHQPSDLDKPRKQGVDLQLSGHTHAGQFFPVSLATSLIFEEDNGYLKDGAFNLIVSSGYGTWGPAVRVGSQSQIVDITVNFK